MSLLTIFSFIAGTVVFVSALWTNQPQFAIAMAVMLAVLQLQRIIEILEKQFKDKE